MPLFKELRWNQFQIAIWKIDAKEAESFDPRLLSDLDQKRLQGLKNPGRRAEFLSARLALEHLTEEAPLISYSEKGAPQMENWLGISLSHNRDYAAAMVSKSHQVGIDLEAYRSQMAQLAPRYMSKQELHAIGPQAPLEHLAAYWSAKETMIKLLDAPELDLRQEIRIAPFKLGKSALSKALVRGPGKSTLFPLYFKMESDYCLCFSYR